MTNWYEITVDGKSYQGEDYERTYSADYGGKGWHISNHGNVNHLMFDELPPKLLCGKTGMMGALERIERYAYHGLLKFKNIKIEQFDDKDEDFSVCPECDRRMQVVRPGKYQCVYCDREESHFFGPGKTLCGIDFAPGIVLADRNQVTCEACKKKLKELQDG